ncbi:MAG: DUF4340 domain-containing protein [Microcoleaceae cyanobacterium]
MKLQQSTLILMVLALGLGGYVYLAEIRGGEKQAEIASQDQQIFTFSRDEVQALTVKTPNQTVTIERVGEGAEAKKSPWKIIAPVQSLANQAAVDELLRQLTSSPSLSSDPESSDTAGTRRITVKPEELGEYGLDRSGNEVELKLKNSETYRLVFGKTDFSNTSMYAQVDPAPAVPEGVSVFVIPASVLGAASLTVDQWKLTEPEISSPKLEPNPKTSPKSESLIEKP